MQKNDWLGLKGLAAFLLALSLGAALPVQAQPAKAGKAAVSTAGAKSAVKPGARQTSARKTVKSVRKAPSRATRGNAARRAAARPVPASPSLGHLYGLQRADDPLDLKSSVALVIDQDTDEVLFSKNPEAILPIASITKLMTALVVTEAGLSLDDTLVVTQDDVNATAGSGARSRLSVGTALSRGEMLHLALMSSENRAAHVLGRTYPGGITPFITAMNAKAKALGMGDTRYVEPTGLSSDNRSSAQDLALLVRAASDHPIIRDLSTSTETVVPVGRRQVQFNTTNGLVRNPDWDIGLQKTGYISAAGRCLVMQTQVAGRKLIMVLLDSAGKYSRLGDAERLRKWLAAAPFVPSAMAASLPAVHTSPRTAAAASVRVAPVAPLVPGASATLLGPVVSPVALPSAAIDQPR
ncbi:MAG: D-alanyl-D-alanine endopeptidase [Rubrivivax sp.]|nr:D-alanyl-D-alanine endopeptidase [Rubrivivax sp.]